MRLRGTPRGLGLPTVSHGGDTEGRGVSHGGDAGGTGGVPWRGHWRGHRRGLGVLSHVPPAESPSPWTPHRGGMSPPGPPHCHRPPWPMSPGPPDVSLEWILRRDPRKCHGGMAAVPVSPSPTMSPSPHRAPQCHNVPQTPPCHRAPQCP